MLQTSMFLGSIVRSSFRPTIGFAFQVDLFDARFRDFIDWLLSDTVEVVTITPLSGVAGECSSPIVLSDTTELDQLTEIELTRALSVGAIRSLGGLPIFTNEPPVWGLRVRHRWAKLIGQRAFDAPESQAEVMLAEESTSRELECAVTVMRIHKKGAFTPVARLTFAGGLGSGQGTSYSILSADDHGFRSYEISERDRSSMEGLARDVASRGVRQRPYVENAARRFSFAGERRRSDDRLLDLMIAAESLFLGHIQEREGELRFRLSVHAGHLIGRNATERRDIARHMRLAYDTRSAIVHGGSPSPEKWGSTPTRATSLEEFTQRTEDIMREGLQSAVGLAAHSPGRGPFFDWDAAIYDRRRTRAS